MKYQGTTKRVGKMSNRRFLVLAKMMRGYRYFFYRVYRYQLLGPWKGMPLFAANVGIYAVGMMVAANVLSLLFIINHYFNLLGASFLLNLVWIVCAVSWFITVYVIFTYKDRYKKIIKEFCDETDKERKIRGAYIWIYTVATFAFLIYSMFWFNG